MADKFEEARKLADRLRGTCENYELDHPLYNDLEFCQELDEIVRRCEGCDWWVDAHELDENEECGDCREG